jgi:RNA polymerase sigma-70 factor (ECF subfamily)
LILERRIEEECRVSPRTRGSFASLVGSTYRMRALVTERPPTQILIEQAKAGNRGAFDELIGRFRQRLRSELTAQLASHRATAVEVEEILQETLVRAFESLDRFQWRGDGSFLPWLCGIARNVIGKAMRGAHRKRHIELADRISGDGISPSKSIRRNERFDRLEEALAKLKPEYREVLRLVRLEGLRIRDVAVRMDRSEYAVKHLLARAIRKLGELFGETESFHLPHRELKIEGDENGTGQS